MIKRIVIALASFFTVTGAWAQKSIYDYKLKGINGDVIDLSKYKGKKILFVNVASKCGFTPQYAGLEELYKRYGDKLVVIGLPCNQFLWQEPGDAKAIQKFCSAEYNVSFPMTDKVKVKGRRQSPIYQFLTHKAINGLTNEKPKWNFYKYLVDESGHLVAVFPSKVEPLSQELLTSINK